MCQKAVMRYQSVYPSLPMLAFLRGSRGPVVMCVSLCVRPKGVSERPVGEQIGQPVCDFAPGWFRAKERPVFMCVERVIKESDKIC